MHSYKATYKPHLNMEFLREIHDILNGYKKSIRELKLRGYMKIAEGKKELRMAGRSQPVKQHTILIEKRRIHLAGS